MIVLSQLEDPQLISYLWTLGIKSFLTKDTPPEEMKQAIQLVILNERYLPAKFRETINVTASEKTKTNKLSHQELRLLELLQRGYTSKEVAKEMSLTVKTIETYRERILEKTKTKNVAELISYAFRTGWLN